MLFRSVLKRHGITPFNPTGEQFDPNLHEALYQAPIPDKEPGTVIETQEIGCASIASPRFRAGLSMGSGSAATWR